jgi:hypothetical protein
MGIRTFCLRRKIVRRCRPLCPLSLNLLVDVEVHARIDACRVLPEIVPPPPPFQCSSSTRPVSSAKLFAGG